MAAQLLATTELSTSEVARMAQVTESQLMLWWSDAKFIRLIEEMKMRAGSSKHSSEARTKVAMLFAKTNLNQRDIALLAQVPQTQVSRWARDPEFNRLVEDIRRRMSAVSDDDDRDDDGGEWSPVITTFHYKKSGGK